MITLLETFILFSITPAGFILIASLLLFCEYHIGKSIAKDIDFKPVKIFLNDLNDYRKKFTSTAISKIKDMPSITETTINYVRMNNWFS